MEQKATCGICGEPMPEGEEMFKYHGFSCPCPKQPLSRSKDQCARQEASKAEPAKEHAEIMHEDAPRAKVGAIGNELHNMSCLHQNDERLSKHLGELASRSWELAKEFSSEPAKEQTTEVDSSEILEDRIHTDEGPSRPVSRVVRYKLGRPTIDDPWTEWSGGECPIKDPDAVVEIKLRDKTIRATSVNGLFWKHDPSSSDIIAYRVLRSSCPEDYEMPKKPVVRVEWMGRYGIHTAWWEHHVPCRGSTYDFYLRTELHDGKLVSVRPMTREEAMREVEG